MTNTSVSKSDQKNQSTSNEVVRLDIKQALLEVQEYYSAGQLKQAQRLCKDVLELDPFNEMALRQLGIICHRLQEWVYARDCFMRLTGLKSGANDETVFYNLGHTSVMLDDPDLAFAAFSKTIELNPDHARAHNNLGAILEKHGDYEDAIEYFYDACELDPLHVLSRMHLIDLLSQLHRYDECNDLIEDSLAINTMSPDQRGRLLTQHAVNAWVEGDIKSCKRAMRLCKHVMPHMKEAREETQVVLHRLVDLIEYRSLHPEVYSGEYDRDIYYIGDEQCLYSADTLLHINEMDYRVVPYLVSHGSVAKISDEKMNTAHASFEMAVGQIPAGSHVLLGFGLEDLNPVTGLFEEFKHGKENNAHSLDSTITDLVSDYVNITMTICEGQHLKPTFVGVPASNENLRDLSVEDQMRYFELLEKLNDCLSDTVLEYGVGFVDVYSATVGENGRSTCQFHMDEQYLTPSALPEIIEQYLLKPKFE